MMKENISTTKIKEIDVISLTKRVFCEKILLAKFVFAFIILGVVYALGTPKEYTASVVLAPEANSLGMSSNLNDIASMMGVDMGKNGKSADAIYPDIYPNIFASTDFVIKLFDVPVRLKNTHKTKPYSEHLLKDTPTPFWEYPLKWIGDVFKSSGDTVQNKQVDAFQLTPKQFSMYKLIKGRIDCLSSKGTNIITITATDYDPMVAAIVADTLQSRLQEYIFRYRTQKARKDLAFAMRLNEEAKKQYTKARQLYSSYSDANMDVILTSYKSKIQDLENDLQMKYNNYSQTSKQVEQAKAKVQENTPAFTIIQQASVPVMASSTPRSFMVLGFAVMGFLCGALWVLVLRDFVAKYRKTKTIKNNG
ncbi:MAG: Wzz/FepE/Etk N-terminal domain-containing protein [Prevotella conceptionensis]